MRLPTAVQLFVVGEWQTYLSKPGKLLSNRLSQRPQRFSGAQRDPTARPTSATAGYGQTER